MRPRDRVLAALRRRPTDRVPIFMWFHPGTAARLADRLEIPAAYLPQVLGDDIRQAWVGNNYAMEGIVHAEEGGTHVDDWGVRWVRRGPFNQIQTYPLRTATAAELARYRFPHRRIAALLRSMEHVWPLHDRYFIGCDVSPCLFEMACRLLGMERAILDLAGPPAQPDGGLLEKACGFSVELATAACAAGPLDWLWTGDDVGSQQALIMSPATWRQRIAPLLGRITAVGRQHGLWVAYHSCGAIRPIIPDLIELGVDVLNPVQANCPGMSPLELKREFGDVLTFMGGVDTQELLPHGEPLAVQRVTEELIAHMTADGGGYILAASHAVPPETPLDNIFAMYAAAGLSRAEILDTAAAQRARLAARDG